MVSNFIVPPHSIDLVINYGNREMLVLGSEVLGYNLVAPL
jgi:hypothetical protein